MKRFTSSLWLTAVIAFVTLCPALQPCAADDEGRLWFVPEEHPGPPYYAIVVTHESQDLVPIIFIRPPGCIPENFNLLDFFDMGGAQSCPLNVEGFRVAPQFFGPPTLLHLQNPVDETVPIWFVSQAEFLGETLDGVLTIGDVEEMDTLVMGWATRYEDTQSILATLPKVHIVANGILADGRTFRFHLEEHFVEVGDEVVHYDLMISE